MTREGPLGYGLIGCGGFGLFCLDQYRSMSEVAISAVADVDVEAAAEAARRFDVAACTPEELLARDDVDIVHVATPPFTHRDLAVAALRAGKHVLCEKPLAVRLADAHDIVNAAREADRLVAVNLIMRYDPLCLVVKRIVERDLLGAPLHAFFENDAKDESLPAGHWFWDVSKSGGIFIEHGVHFFDLFEWWFGGGRIVSAHALRRPGADLVEHVTCTAVYGDTVIANFYHGFHQAERMDRQETRIEFERAEVSLDEWVPVRLRLDAILDEQTIDKLKHLMPGAQLVTVEKYSRKAREVISRHKSYFVDRRITMTYDLGMTKPELYGHVLRELLAEQAAAIRNPDHPRRITGQNGIRSLEMAVDAECMARGGM